MNEAQNIELQYRKFKDFERKNYVYHKNLEKQNMNIYFIIQIGLFTIRFIDVMS